MKLLFVADPIESFKTYKDTTYTMMREATRRGHAITVCEPRHLRWQSGQRVMAQVRDIALTGDEKNWFTESARREAALADFQEALTYPANLGVGRKYKPTEAEACYWAGKMLHQLGRAEEARAVWTEGAGQVDKQSPVLPFITVTDAQDGHVKKCAAALELL